MKLIVRFSPVVAALALAMACGDDDDASSTMEKCKSPYPERTAAQLKMETTATGKCADDTAAVCATDVISETSDCAQTCFAMYPEDSAMAGACTLSCLKEGVSPTPSDGCLSCYVASVGCTAQYCLAECLSGGAADLACTACRKDNGCTAAFYACSGLPLPVASGTGGTGSGGKTSSGGAVSTGGVGGMGDAGMTSGGVGATSGGGGAPGEGGGGGTGPVGGGAPGNAGAGG